MTALCQLNSMFVKIYWRYAYCLFIFFFCYLGIKMSCKTVLDCSCCFFFNEETTGCWLRICAEPTNRTRTRNSAGRSLRTRPLRRWIVVRDLGVSSCCGATRHRANSRWSTRRNIASFAPRIRRRWRAASFEDVGVSREPIKNWPVLDKPPSRGTCEYCAWHVIKHARPA